MRGRALTGGAQVQTGQNARAPGSQFLSKTCLGHESLRRFARRVGARKEAACSRAAGRSPGRAGTPRGGPEPSLTSAGGAVSRREGRAESGLQGFVPAGVLKLAEM